MSDYDFLRTGNNTQHTDDGEEYVKNMMSVYMVFAEDATKIAAQYTEHLNMRVVSEKNISKAMKIRAINSEVFWNQPGVLERLNSMKRILETDDDEDTLDDETEYCEDYEEVQQIECAGNCDFCALFDSIEEKWNDWVPQTRQDISLKNAIDRATSVI